MLERSTICTLYSAYVTLDHPRRAHGPGGTRRGPPGRTTIRGRMGAASTDTQRFHSAFSNRPNEAARPAARSARVPHMLPHTPHMLPIHARASAPSPRRFRCQTVPVNVETSVRREQTQAGKGLYMRSRGAGTPS